MPSQEQIMLQILALFGAGAALPTTIPAVDVLRQRYFDWIVQPKPGLQSPQELWDTVTGLMLQGKFGEIGVLAGAKTLAAGKLAVGADECLEACTEVEATSECPHCPATPG
jgi:hypothetical protein